MKWLTTFALLLLTVPAAAQETGGFSAGPGERPSDYGAGVEGVSPTWTQDRTFPGTRFWKLDAGSYEVETWWNLRKNRDEDPFHLLQAELEIGLTPRIQLDLYEVMLVEDGTFYHEGNKIEARIAVDPVFGSTPLNPVIYLEWHPRHLDSDRAEVRLLLGDEILGPKLVAAANLFYEQNVTMSADGMGGRTYIPNPEAGITAAASYAVAAQRLRVGAEAKFALEKEEFDDASWEKQLLVGPNLSTRLAGEKLKLYATVLFGLTEDAKEIDSFLVLGSGF